MQAARLILLYDPEHLTAANFRKRRLVTLSKRYSASDNILQSALRAELLLLDSILTSPLHRQTKSPTLWHHRAWLLRLEMAAAFLQRQPFLEAELHIVLQAAGRHPCNYYAWQYARGLLHYLQESTRGVNNGAVAFITNVKSFCFTHPSDTSAWSFLLFLLARIEIPLASYDLVGDVLAFVFNMRLPHTSVWVFLRTAICAGWPRNCIAKADILAQLREFVGQLEGSQNHSEALENARSAIRWIEFFSDSSDR